MKIYNNNGVPVNKLYQAAQDENKKDVKRAEERPEADRLAISGEAAKMRELVKEAAASEEVRTEKVREVREAIANRTFVVDAKKIAEAMLKKED